MLTAVNPRGGIPNEGGMRLTDQKKQVHSRPDSNQPFPKERQ